MKIITLGIALSLLVGSTALEAHGNFRRIYESKENPNDALPETLNYLQRKMVETHKLNDMAGEEGQFQWDLYLFKKFVKSNLLAQKLIDEPSKRESFYRAYHASALFMLRSAGAECDPDFNSDVLRSVTFGIAILKNIKDIITPEAIGNWVKNPQDPKMSQEIKGKELLAKSHIIKAWHEWTKVKSEKGNL